MPHAFLCDAIRTPVGSYGGSLAYVRTDDLAAIPIRALIARNPGMDVSRIDDVVLGCANQAGEDNRNVGRMALLLAGLPATVPGSTINRLCGSGMDAISIAARAIVAGEQELVMAGGVESMSRAPFVMGKATTAFSRTAEIFDTTIGWRFVNELMKQQYGIESMPETAENVADEYRISREDQDRFAVWSQAKAAAAMANGALAEEIVPVTIPRRKQDPLVVDRDEHPRPGTNYEKISTLPALFRKNGTVTAANASGINDGACALIVASEEAAKEHGLTPRGRVISTATAGVPPRTMGIGPVPATQRLLSLTGLRLEQFDVIELNEAFAAQALAVTRELGLADDDPRLNPNGGAIALGHPLGMSGARIVTTALHELQRRKGRLALCTMCIGVGQGIAMVIERV
ncbi:MAG: 3-oxoadipyl-CoA thiolase [Acidobacteriota bacterium]